jgi:hypothetical protein
MEGGGYFYLMDGYLELTIAYCGNAGLYRSEKIEGVRLLNAISRQYPTAV